MAHRKQLTWTELRVGLFVLVGMLVLVVGILKVTATGILAAKYRLRTFLPEVEGLNIGAPVRLDGLEIGSVDAISINPNPKPGDRLHNIQVVMAIDKRYQNWIRTDSAASLITEGLLGNRYVTIARGVSGAPLPPDAEVAGTEEKAIKNIVERGADLVQNLNQLSGHVREIVDAVKKGRGTLGLLLTNEDAYNHLNSTLAKFDQIATSTQSGQNTLGKFLASDELYKKVDTTASRIDSIIADVQAQKGSFGKFVYDPSLYDHAKQFVEKGNTVVEDIQAGKGTLGKLYTDDSLYSRWREAGSHLESATAKLNATDSTAGRMFSDPKLYDNLTGLTGDMRLLLGEFRQNPKKYLRVKFAIF